MFCKSLLVNFSFFSFVHCVVCPSTYGFSLPLCYLQTFPGVSWVRKPSWHGYCITYWDTSCYFVVVNRTSVAWCLYIILRYALLFSFIATPWNFSCIFLIAQPPWHIINTYVITLLDISFLSDDTEIYLMLK